MNVPSINETLSTQAFYVLLALTDKRLHGYGIRDQAAHDSYGSVVMATGTVYGLLKRMCLARLVNRNDDLEENGKMIARYELTSMGKSVLKMEVERLETISKYARYKLSTMTKL